MRAKENIRKSVELEAWLSISFSGPMFFDFSASQSAGQVDIYVPYCPYHQAGFFFQTSSYSETGLFSSASNGQSLARAYSIQCAGISPSTSAPQPIYPFVSSDSSSEPSLKTYTPSATGTAPARADGDGTVYLLSIGSAASRRLQSEQSSTLNKALLKLSVPSPRYLASLYTDTLQVCVNPKKPTGFSGTSNGSGREHATAIRFYYSWNGSPVYLTLPNAKQRLITPPVFKEVPALSDIEVRYEGIGLEDDNDPHSDAHSCFASLNALAGTNWWLNYGDGRTSPTCNSVPKGGLHLKPNPGNQLPRSLFIRTGDDCHAPIVTTGLTL